MRERHVGDRIVFIHYRHDSLSANLCIPWMEGDVLGLVSGYRTATPR